jgi:hypothetical protein
MSNLIFADKDPDEVDDRGLDFTNLLESGETLTGTPTVTATTFLGVDATPSSILFGSPSIEGAVVWQRLRAGSDGVVYRLKYTVGTTASRSFVACGLLRVEAC